MMLQEADFTPERELWKQREAALAAGEPWEESRVGHFQGGPLLSQADIDRYIASGDLHHCRQCSSPRQVVFHN